MRYLDAPATRQALPMAACIEAMTLAFSDDREVPVRVLLGGSMFMPARVGGASGIKVVSVVPGNPVGIVAVFGEDGSPLGLVDGPTLTAIRTAAGAGLATSLMAPEDASVMAMLGAGAMAADQIAAVREVRPIERVVVWSRTPERALALAERVGAEPATDANQAVAGANVITTATPATEPLFDSSAVGSNTHINAVGAFTPEMCEIPPETVRRSFTVVDDVAAAAEEAGDLLQAGKEPEATMADLLARRIEPRAGITFFKSVGIGSQDVAAGLAALERAEHQDLGREL